VFYNGEAGIWHLERSLNSFQANSRLMLTKDKADKLIEIFVSVDDFCINLDDWLKTNPQEHFKKPR